MTVLLLDSHEEKVNKLPEGLQYCYKDFLIPGTKIFASIMHQGFHFYIILWKAICCSESNFVFFLNQSADCGIKDFQ